MDKSFGGKEMRADVKLKNEVRPRQSSEVVILRLGLQLLLQKCLEEAAEE